LPLPYNSDLTTLKTREREAEGNLYRITYRIQLVLLHDEDFYLMLVPLYYFLYLVRERERERDFISHVSPKRVKRQMILDKLFNRLDSNV